MKTFNVKIVGGRGGRTGKKNCPHCFSLRYEVVWRYNKKEIRYVTRQCEDCFTKWDVSCKDEYDTFDGNEYDPVQHEWVTKG